MTDWGEPLDDGDETKRTLRELEEDEAKVLDDEIKYVLYELVKEDAETLVLVHKVHRSLTEERSWFRRRFLREAREDEAKVIDDEIKYVQYELEKQDAETLVLVDKVYRSLLEQRSWLRGQLLRKTRNESMADEALEEAISRALRLTHSWGGNFKPTTAWVLRQASYVLVDLHRARRKITYAHQLQATEGKDGDKIDAIEAIEASALNPEDQLVAVSRERVIRERYLGALRRLAPVQRAAWILCRDELLNPDEAERLIAPPLHWRTARVALAKRPMPDSEASRLLGRDVSPDASKAMARLRKELSDFAPAALGRSATRKNMRRSS